MQVEGRGQRIEADQLRDLMEQSSSLRRFLLRFVHVFMTHVARTAFANGRETIEARLARWLLMAHDRLDSDEIPLTHQLLSIMLGTTRPGVTVVLQTLEKKGLIGLHRKRIIIENRAGLKERRQPRLRRRRGGTEAANLRTVMPEETARVRSISYLELC